MLAAAIDGSVGSAVSLRLDESLELRFKGGPRWINQVLVFTDALEFEIQALELDRSWRTLDTAAGVGATLPATIVHADSKVLGLRIRPHQARNEATIRLFELEAYFVQSDPDSGEVGAGDAADYFYEWIENYSSAPLTNCEADAEGLFGALPSGWVNNPSFGNGDAWEEDFKREDAGGTNNTYVDAADLSYFAGHGEVGWDWHYFDYKRSMSFSENCCDDDEVVPGDARNAWGNGDMEWIGLSGCRMLTSGSRDQWAKTMNGLHLICGWSTDMHDNPIGSRFGSYMVSSSSTDPAKTIKSSWFNAAEYWEGPGFTPVVVGENSTMGNDYLWGEGTTGSDPTVNDTYSYWSFNTTSALTAPEPDLPAAPSDAVVLLQRTPAGRTVIVDRSIVEQFAAAPPMRIFDIQPVVIDDAHVRGIANRLCSAQQSFCGAEVGPDAGLDHINAIDGAWEMRVSTDGGAVHVENTSTWLAWRTEPANLPSTSQAVAMANSMLDTLQLRPPGAFVDTVDYVSQGERTLVGEQWQDVAETSSPTAVRVRYQRRLGAAPGFPVAGPGGSMTVAFGSDGSFQRLFRGAWRHLVPGALVPVLPVETIIQALNQRGADATITGINSLADEIQINSVALGYFEPAAGTHPQSLRPVYILDATLTRHVDATHSESSPHQIYMFADALPPVATISSPLSGATFAAGTQVCFEAAISGGQPPYTIRWSEDLAGGFGTSVTACATFTGGDPDRAEVPTTVKLSVTDSAGMRSHAFVDVQFTAAPPGTTACAGDGTATPCPCDNEGIAGHGCANSVSVNGALLTANGMASVGSDTLVLIASGMPDSTVLYFQGTVAMNGGLGTVFGDGLRCAGGAVIRLDVKSNVGGSSAYPIARDASISTRGQCTSGAQRVYQVWYRNASIYCSTATFNLSNGLTVTWTE